MDVDDLQARRIADQIVTAQAARRRRTRSVTGAAGVAVVTLAVVVAVAVAVGRSPSTSGNRSAAVAAGRAALPPGRSPVAPGSSAGSAQPQLPRIYAALITGRTAARPAGRTAGLIYVADTFCTGMPGMDGRQRGPCRSGPVPPALQAEIVRLTGPRVRFAARLPAPQNGIVVEHIGTVTVRGDRAEAALDVTCGPMCGQGDTKVLTRHGDQWFVTGAAGGYAWIS